MRGVERANPYAPEPLQARLYEQRTVELPRRCHYRFVWRVTWSARATMRWSEVTAKSPLSFRRSSPI
jgi:hypothetical protein